MAPTPSRRRIRRGGAAALAVATIAVGAALAPPPASSATSPLFAPPVGYNTTWPTPFGPGLGDVDVGVGDFNGDGIPDVAHTRPGFTETELGQLDIYLGNGDGTLQTPPRSFTVPRGAGPIVTEDFNKDGLTEVAFVYGTVGQPNVGQQTGVVVAYPRLLAGTLTFTQREIFPIGALAQELTKGDFDNDGFTDLAVALGGPAYGTTVPAGERVIEILIADANGNTFIPQFEPRVPTVTKRIDTGDFNGDGKLDLVATEFHETISGTDNEAYVLLGDGTGNFPTVNTVPFLDQLNEVVAADVNNDGRSDLVGIAGTLGGGQQPPPGTFAVRLSNGDGTFGPLTTLPAHSRPRDVIVADFNLDGILDAAVAHDVSTIVAIFTGKGDGTFNPFDTVDLGFTSQWPSRLETGDLNRDGKPDLVVNSTNPNGNSTNLTVLLNVAGTPGSTSSTSSSVPSSTTSSSTSTTMRPTTTSSSTSTTMRPTTTSSSTSTSVPSSTTSTTGPSAAACAGQTATIVGTNGPDTIMGTPGPDVIAGLGGDDTISGLGGNDTICGGDGDDTIDGGRGNDTLRGNDGNDRLNGQADNDGLEGGSGNDRLIGGTGSDTLTGNQGTDTLSAVDTPNAPDTLTGGPDGDRCFSDPTDTPPSLNGADC